MSLDLFYFSGGPRERVLQAVIEAGHNVRHVYVNNPKKWPKVQGTIEFSRSIGLPVSVIEKKSDLDALAVNLAGSFCLSAGFTYLFPKAFLESISICLNVHGSLLPKYAGARTLAWAIENGEVESGVTVHRVDEGMDTGPILLQRAFPLSLFETTASLARKTTDFEPQVVVDALSKFETMGESGFKSQLTPSLPALPNRIPAHSEVDPTLPLLELVDKIRAANTEHYPSYFYLHGQKIYIKLWRPDRPSDEADLM